MVPMTVRVKNPSRCLSVSFIMSSLREMMSCRVMTDTLPSLVRRKRRSREYTAWEMIGAMMLHVFKPGPGLGFIIATCLCAVFIASHIIGSNTNRTSSFS